MIAYLDLPAGLSGDMFLGCLVDAGWPIEALRSAVAALDLPAGSVAGARRAGACAGRCARLWSTWT